MTEKIKVLDHGYVQLVDTWGRLGVEEAAGDEAIVAAARMSTGKGFLGWGPKCANCGDLFDAPERDCPKPSGAKPYVDCGRGGHKFDAAGDEKLLQYLYSNRHMTPFEMGGATFEIMAPIFVFREWHRHRTQCLSGDTMITCVSPRGTTYKRSVKSIFELKYGGVIDQARLLRVLNEETLEFDVLPMADVWESGVKALWRLETDTGRTIETSAEHPFFTRRGWVKMKALRIGDEVARLGKVASGETPTPPALRRGIGVWTSMMRTRLIRAQDTCYLCDTLFKASLLELDHVVPVSENLLKALDPKNLRPVCKRCHRNKTNAEQPSREGTTMRGVRWEKVIATAETTKAEMTYDIEVDGPHHNYVANDLVVHNSYNEMSARYTPLPDVNYIPSVERLMINAGTGNKQAGTVGGSKELTEANAQNFRDTLDSLYKQAEEVYQEALLNGVPKELARVHLPVGRYSRMRASANLRNWLQFLTLRNDVNAQWEIRQFAQVVEQVLKGVFPKTIELFTTGRSR